MKETITIYVYAVKYHDGDYYHVMASTATLSDRNMYDIQIIDTIEYQATVYPRKLEATRKENEQQDLRDKKARLQAELDELNAQLSK